MDFQEELNVLVAKRKKFGDKLQTEEATKNSLVLPFIKLLGYDPFDPTEVVPEFSAAIGKYKDARVDFALMRDGHPVIIIECKAYGSALDAENCNQLRIYFHGTEAKVAILTDGNRYQFFSDLDEPNVMDNKPYMEFVLEKPDNTLIPELKKLSHDAFNVDDAMSSALVLKYTREFKRVMEEQLQQPEDEFLKFFLKRCYDGMCTSAVKERFTPILKDALDLLIRDKINERLQSAIDDNKPKVVEAKPVEDKPSEPVADDDGIVTTEEEKEAHIIVKSILHGVVEADKVCFYDYKSYSNVCFVSPRKVIMRCYFNNSNNKSIGFIKLDDTTAKSFETLKISKVDEIFNYADRIKRVAEFWANGGSIKAPAEDGE